MSEHKVRWTPDGDYIIGNFEYGYDLCRVNIYQKMKDELPSDVIESLINKVAEMVDCALREKEAK